MDGLVPDPGSTAGTILVVVVYQMLKHCWTSRTLEITTRTSCIPILVINWNTFDYSLLTVVSDSNGSGGSAPCVDPSVGMHRNHIKSACNWLVQCHRTLSKWLVGWKTTADEVSWASLEARISSIVSLHSTTLWITSKLTAMYGMLYFLIENRFLITSLRMGWTYWAGGPRFASSHLSVEPVGYPPRENEQLLTVMNYVQNQIVSKQYPDISKSGESSNALTQQ